MIPETVITDGYGVAGAGTPSEGASLIVIGAGFVNTAWGWAFSAANLAADLPCAWTGVESDEPIRTATASKACSDEAAKTLLYIKKLLSGERY